MTKRKPKPTPQIDYGPDQRIANGEIDFYMPKSPDGTLRGPARARVRHACHLEYYWNRGMITRDRFAAGLQFAILWYQAHGSANVIAKYGAEQIKGSADSMSVRRVKARDDVRKALDAIRPEYRDTITTVCGLDRPGGVGCQKKLWFGLKDLVEHWQIGKDAPLPIAA